MPTELGKKVVLMAVLSANMPPVQVLLVLPVMVPFRVIVSPWQTLWSMPASTVKGSAFTVMVVVAVVGQLPLVV